jgi:hypothetical protein
MKAGLRSLSAIASATAELTQKRSFSREEREGHEGKNLF